MTSRTDDVNNLENEFLNQFIYVSSARIRVTSETITLSFSLDDFWVIRTIKSVPKGKVILETS